MEEKSSRLLSNPVKRGSVVQMVLERIKNAILEGELNPGDFLPSEAVLVEKLGVGKTSIREAVKMLEAMGIVEVRQGQGTKIRRDPGADTISPLIYKLLIESGSAADLLELRMMFEPAYAVIAMRKATQEQTQALLAIVEQLENHVNSKTQTPDDYLNFHRLILQATGNPFIIRIGTTILELFRYSIERSMHTIPEIAVQNNKAILEAFKKKDEEELVRQIVQSYQGWKKSLDLI